MKKLTTADVLSTLSYYPSIGNTKKITRLEIGHINDTYIIEEDNGKRYLLQRLSPVAFKEPLKVMENIVEVTSFLKESLLKEGKDPSRECLSLIANKEGLYYTNKEDGCLRIYNFIEGSTSYDSPKNEEMFKEAARAFGRFQYLLRDFPSEKLFETIPHFHDTPKRVKDFLLAVKENRSNRKENAKEAIEFALERKDKVSLVVDGLKDGSIPLRSTHNDTKLNNVLFDINTDKALCVVDLDTIMPGSALYDFGDSIRFGANTAKEDEKDLEKIHFSLPLFKAYTEGFLEGVNGSLVEKEIRLFPYSAWLMTYECGIRFLGDYLNGDIYFHTAYPEHNLVRAIDQFTLLKDMERQMDEAESFISSLLNK